MNSEFSRTLSLLRQEKGVSQRVAATALGISQALLSHYENGIRGPGLAFVVRACDYYGVSADYLLGRTLSKDGSIIAPDELYDLSDEKDNSMRGSVLALLSKKLLVNSVGVLFDLLGKTGALLHFAARAGWMAGRGTVEAWDEPEAVALGKFGDALAIAFQLRDDYLGIFGKFEEFGKPIGSDLQESKATMLLIHALNNLQGTQKAELQALLGRDSYSASDIKAAQELFYQSGSVDKLLDAINDFSHQAQEALNGLPESASREFLKTLTDYLIDREK